MRTRIKLGDYCEIEKGAIGIKKAIPGKYPLVVTAKERLTHNEFQFDCKAVIVPLVSSTGHGHASINRIHYQEGKFALGTILAAIIVKDKDIINPKFLYIYLSYFKDHLLVPLMKGTANVTLSIKKIKAVQIILPNLKRQLEIIELEKNNKHINNLKSEITKQKEYVKQLKQSILQEAIQGKLTADWRALRQAQEQPLEPASELLKRIKAEKQKLIKEKKIRKEKSLPPISEGEIPFELPKGWVWCRLGEIITMNYGKSLTKSQTKAQGNYAVYGSNGIVGYYDIGLTDKKAIIIGRKGSAGAIQVSQTGSWTTDVAYYIEENTFLHFGYLVYLLKSLNLDKLGKGIKPGLNRNEAYLLLIPLPPLAEQKVIVEKVESIMQKVSAMEEEIQKSEQNANMLMQAVLKEAFEGKKEEIEV